MSPRLVTGIVPLKNLTIRVSAADRAAWEADAKADGARSLGAWITKTINEARKPREKSK